MSKSTKPVGKTLSSSVSRTLSPIPLPSLLIILHLSSPSLSSYHAHCCASTLSPPSLFLSPSFYLSDAPTHISPRSIALCRLTLLRRATRPGSGATAMTFPSFTSTATTWQNIALQRSEEQLAEPPLTTMRHDRTRHLHACLPCLIPLPLRASVSMQSMAFLLTHVPG